MSNLRKVVFSEFGEIITGKTPSSANPEDFGDETPFVTPSDSFEHKYIDSTQRYLSPEGVKKLKGKLLPANSVLVTCIGSAMGKVGMVRGPSITNQQINSIKINGNFEPEYIYYCLKNNYKLLRNAAGGSTALPLLNKTEFELLNCNVHSDKDEQKKISSVLSSIDQKIELNNRINAELEAMAKTLYDYWFVQFDFPDTNGKPYKTSGGKMAYNSTLKREIPEGWVDSTIGAIEPNIVTGKTPSKDNPEYFGGNVPFITIGDIRGNTYVVSTEETLTERGASTQKNKFLPEDSICVTCIASPGLVGFVTTPAQTNQQINSVVCSNEVNKYYLYFAIKAHFEGAKAKTGNTFANMNKGDFSSIGVLKPSSQMLQLYHEKVYPLFQQIKFKSLENQQLEKLRDWLLPMLMNGQVTVSPSSQSKAKEA